MPDINMVTLHRVRRFLTVETVWAVSFGLPLLGRLRCRQSIEIVRAA